MTQQWQVKVPGKIMLAGEYSVLFGASALATTLDTFLTATITESSDLTLASNLWPTPKVYKTKDDLDKRDPFEACVLRTLDDYPETPLFNLTLSSGFDVSYGVGSSSAMRLASHHAIRTFSQRKADQWETASFSFREQKNFQQKASGYDIATQLLGGVVRFHPTSTQLIQEKNAEQLSCDPQILNHFIQPMVGSTGAPTTHMISLTLAWLEKENRLSNLDRINHNLDRAFQNFLLNASDENLETLIKAAGRSRKFFQGAPNFPAWMEESKSLPDLDQTWTFKLTGAGGEDAVIIIGKPEDRRVGEAFFKQHKWRFLPASFTDQGLTVTEHTSHE